jgi:hypothetical protein
MLPRQLWKLESSHQGLLIASEGGVHAHSKCLGASAILLHHALICLRLALCFASVA